MRLDPRFYMSLSSNPDHDQAEKAIDRSQPQTIVLSDEQQLPAKVANVSREELRKYAQCKRVGNYLLGRTVGEGSFAKVKEAIHILTGEKVAIKVIDKNRARKDRYVSKNMRREARLLQMIRHPHIVQLLEIVETSQCYYLVFEFADGGDLMDYICKRRKLEEDEVRKFIRQIISAVEYLHRLGIMHRDLKVENLLLDANKNIKIIDFGLSNTIYSPDPNNENHCTTQCGSPAYAAPELLVRKDYGPQIDVWSIGVNLYAMLTGRLPYTVEPFNISTLYNKMLKRQMNVIPEYLSEACKDMIYQLLNPNPKERLHILEAVRHRWITMDQRDPLSLIPCPNYLCEEDLDDRILDHVEEQLKLNSDDIIRDLIQNKATKNSCVYHLLVRRLERHEREQRKLISTPPPSIHIREEKPPASPEHKVAMSTNNHTTAQKNGLVLDKRSTPKTHIIENPFKTIKVALIRQKKAVKNEEKSKQASNGKTLTQDPVSHSTSKSEPTSKPKLCTVKRVALVKVSPARRSFRGLTSGSRNCTNSPRPGRRRSYFEGLQQRRKSPKVRRQHAEPDDPLPNNGNNARQKGIDDDVVHKTQRMRIEDDVNNNIPAPNCASKEDVIGEKTANSDVKPQNCTTTETHYLEDIPENDTHIRNNDLGSNASETVTHLYTNKGVVLKRDSSGENVNHKTNYKQEQDTVQHHIFHGGDKAGDTGDVKDEQGCRRINGVNSKQGTAGSVVSKVEVVNAKISPAKEVETVKSTSERSSNTSTPRQTSRQQTQKDKLTPKPGTSKRTPGKLDTSSKIPVLAAKNSPISRQSTLSPTRLAPSTPSPSTANTRLPGTAARRNEIAKLADKYNKCVSMIVVNRSTSVGKGSSDNGKSSSGVGKGSTGDKKGSTSDAKGSSAAVKGSSAAVKGSSPAVINAKGIAAKVEGVSTMNNSKNRNMQNGKITRVSVAKGTSLTVNDEREKTQACKERCVGTNLTSGGNNGKAGKIEQSEEKEIREKKSGQHVERTRNGLQRQKTQDHPSPRPSLVRSAKESLVSNASRTTSKDSKQTVQNNRKNSANDGKFPSMGRPQRSTVKSPEEKDTKSWTKDERRKISSYKKTNEPQQTKPVVKRETKIAASDRSPAFRTS